MDTLLQDLRYGLRMLLRTPQFTLVAVGVLAVGIGANSAMFGLVNALLYKPLAVEHPEALVRVFSRENKPDGGWRSFSYPNYVDLRERNTAFTALAAFSLNMVGLTEGDNTRRAFAAVVSANYFHTFGVRPALGRDFLPEEERPGSGAPVAIVSYSYWQRHGLDPAVVGRAMLINGQQFQVVGVAPRYFTGTSAVFSPDAWLPLGVYEQVANDFMGGRGRRLNERDHHCLMLLGRLKPGLRPADGEAQLAGLARQMAETYAENKDQVLSITPPHRVNISTNPQGGSDAAGLALLLFPMSGVVLLIACLNLANMMLARASARRREMAVRAALGGGRGRILRQLLTESFLLALAGGAGGLLLAQWTTSALASSLSAKLPFMTIVFRGGVDGRVLAATFGFCVLATLVFALVPAWKLARAEVLPDLKETSGSDPRTRRGFGLLAPRQLLVIGQLALSLALLTVAGLFYRGAVKAAVADPGFRFDHGLLVEVDASLAGYDEAKGRTLYRGALERIRALPGVESASLASMVPFGMFSDGRAVLPAGVQPDQSAPGREGEAAMKPVFAAYVITGTDYFKTLGLPILRGREFDRVEADRGGAGRVAIIDEPLARKLWSQQEAVGRQLQIVEGHSTNPPTVLEVVGVVPGLKQDLGDKELNPRLYVPFGQHYQAMMNIHVRTAGGDRAAEAGLLQGIRRELRALDERLPVLSATTLRDFHNEGLMMWFLRAGARLFLTFALLALFLAVVGVYGVKAYLVARRTREIGIRMALGATAQRVVWMVLKDGLRLAAAGLGLGFLLALGAGRLVSSRLYDVSGADPWALGLSLGALSVTVLIACWLPARRAARVQPMVALRCE